MTTYSVIAFYHFVELNNLSTLQMTLKNFCKEKAILGTILLAKEGINGTIAGDYSSIQAIITLFKTEPLFSNHFSHIEYKFSATTVPPFNKLKVLIKKEIVTFGVPNVFPHQKTGKKVSAEAWNDLISQKEVLLIDTRNDFEVELGTFKGALNPKTKKFSEFKNFIELGNHENHETHEKHEWPENHGQRANHGQPKKSGKEGKTDKHEQQEKENNNSISCQRQPLRENKKNISCGKNQKIALFCTGGIRCEKASSYLLDQGFTEVYQLEGGILKYLEKIPTENSLWEGECFIFDNRVLLKKEEIHAAETK